MHHYSIRLNVKNQGFWLFAAIIFVLALLPVISLSAASKPTIVIDKGASSTTDREVTLTLNGGGTAKEMKIAENQQLSGANWESFKPTKFYTLAYGSGTKTVFVKFRDAKGNTTETVKDTITLSVPTSMSVSIKINKGDKKTTSRYVSISLAASPGVETVKLSNSSNFSLSDEQDATQKTLTWILSAGSGTKVVSAEFTNANGNKKVVTASIEYTEPKNILPAGKVIKAQGDTLYYVGLDGRLHPFSTSAVFHSWYKDFSKVVFVSSAAISQYQIGTPVCIRPGTWLVRFFSGNTVYAVEPGCILRRIRSEAEAVALYGPYWQKRILVQSDIHAAYYTVRNLAAQTGTDADSDGLDKETEIMYGSKDTSHDSDSDGVSDYEEIEIWFSNAMDADTDDDGVKDGIEIQLGRSPTGFETVYNLPAGYQYPAGSLIAKVGGGGYFYRHSNGLYYSIGKNTSGSFASNEFDPLFASMTGYVVSFPVAGNIDSSLDEVLVPMIYVQKQMVAL